MTSKFFAATVTSPGETRLFNVKQSPPPVAKADPSQADGFAADARRGLCWPDRRLALSCTACPRRKTCPCPMQTRQAGRPCPVFAAASRMAAFMDRAGARLNRQFADYPRPLGVVGRRSRRLLAELRRLARGCASAARPRAVSHATRCRGRSGFRVPRSTSPAKCCAMPRRPDRAASRSVTRRRTARAAL